MANMLELVTRNFFGKKKVRLYPIQKERDAFERSRGRIVLNPSTCILCSLCARKCPADAITVDRKEGKWELNAYRCIICGECVSACPKKSITMTNERRHSGSSHLFETHKVEPPKPAAPKAPAAAAPKPQAAETPKAEASAESK